MLQLFTRGKIFVVLLLVSFFALKLNAQQLKIADFVLFGGQNTSSTPGATIPSNGFAVNIASSATITNGRIGSYSLIKTTGKPTISSNLNSGGTISLGNSTVIYGSITAQNNSNSIGNALQMGANTYVKNNIDVNGNIFIKSGIVSGNVTHPKGTTYSGPKPGGAEYIKKPNFPVLPQFPVISSFVSGGTTDIKVTRTITPGYYRNMQLTGNQKITFSGPGNYYFKSIHNKNSNTLQFDFKNSATGNIRIYVEGDVELDKITSKLKNGGNASRIYLEVHGNGSTTFLNGFAFTIANDSSTSSSWLGTVWAPYAAINIGSGTGTSYITGALWSATQINIQSGSVIKFAPFKEIKNTDTLIAPGYAPPVNGKSTDLIGPELNSLYQTFSNSTPSPEIYHVSNDSVLIEVVAKVGYYNNAFNKLKNQYGMTDFINNGPGSLFITGKIAISKLSLLNNDTDFKKYVNSIRPVYPAISNTGLATSGGDTSVHADIVRNGFHLTGAGIKVGVLSDGYNTIPGNPAARDVVNEDLPGIGNTVDSTPVDVLLDYPYGRTTDEGRAMLQHVHDIAPGAALAFRTGFISEGDFAQGITQLQQSGCKIITDDVTYLTAPFFKDGLAAQAVNKVKSLGVSYFSAAGNFGTKSYESVFNPVPAPAGFTGEAHNFNNGEGVDILQDDSLQPGSYTIVMQWEDSIYSLGQGGALNDFDIYLVNDDGSILLGMNRPNLGADPIEVLPFYVTANTRTNIMIVRAAGTTPNVRVKFIVYRGELKFNEYATGASTLVGQANAQGAMAVAAARYTRTPAYGVSPALIESFSSAGGTPVNGLTRNKPDFTAPDGGNSTVNFNSLDIEGDGIPNFFGTSAAAPHAAGVAALILQGKQRFYNKMLEPDSVRNILSNTALDMTSVAGFDNISGYGLIQADSAVGSFAAPTPELDSLVIPDSTIPGKSTFTLTLKGKYFKTNTIMTVRGVSIPTQILNSTTATALIKPYKGSPAVRMYTPPITPSKLDGLYSDSLYFLSPAKKNVIVLADNKTKKYGEALPAFTSTILVDGIPLDSSGLTPGDLNLDYIVYTTPATSSSDVGLYFIRPSFKPLSAQDSTVFELYNFTFNDGVLFNNKMPLLITPKDTVITYGDKIGGFQYNYTYDDSLIPVAERSSFLSNISDVHYQNIDTSIVGFVDGKTIINGRTLTDADLQDMGVMASGKTIINGRTIINGKTIINGEVVTDTTRLADLALQSIFNYQLDSSSSPLVSAKTIINGRTIINAKSIINGTAEVNGKTIINGSPVLNSNSVGDTSNQNVVVIIDETDVPNQVNVLSDYKSVNMITGITAGDFRIVPAAMISENFEIRYGIGDLKILPAPLLVKANDTLIYVGDDLPPFTFTITGLKNEDTVVSGPSYTVNPAYVGYPGTFSIIPSNVVLDCPECYEITYAPGTLYVYPYGGTEKVTKPQNAGLSIAGSASALLKGMATATVTPNPTKGKFVITISAGTIDYKMLQVSDMTGRTYVPRINKISAQSIAVELPAGTAAGVYFVRVKVDNGYKVFKVVKL